MPILPILLELQGVHDNLRVIDRDLAAFPPDMARMSTDLQLLCRKVAETEKALTDARARAEVLSKGLKEAKSVEEHARKALKSSGSKVQFTSAIRDLDARERATQAIQKPLTDLTVRIEALEKALEELTSQRNATQVQFEELHQVFLSEHENQVTARERLLTRLAELDASMAPKELTHFNRLLQARQGKAISPVEGGTCTGCRTRLRNPLVFELREKGMVLCESCQRYLYLPGKP